MLAASELTQAKLFGSSLTSACTTSLSPASSSSSTLEVVSPALSLPHFSKFAGFSQVGYSFPLSQRLVVAAWAKSSLQGPSAPGAISSIDATRHHCLPPHPPALAYEPPPICTFTGKSVGVFN